MDTLNPSPEPLKPDLAPAPEALCDDSESVNDRCNLDALSRLMRAEDVQFFDLPMLTRLLRRPYHAVTLEGPLNLKQLAEDHRTRTFRSESTLTRSGRPKLNRLLLRLEGDVFGLLEGHTFKLYAPTPEAAEAVAKEFRRYVRPEAAAKPCFYIISTEPHGPTVETVTIERPAPVSTEELALNYGVDFPSWEQQWREQMYRKPSGLSLLYGPPGCGKTSYLRALMARLLDKAVFYYVPVSEVEMLSSPRFANFWVEQTRRHPKKHKLAILEDAEELLLPRDAGSRDKVSNLLNIADGFLGDHLKLHVVATTNMPMNKLDAAIVRPGRLIGIREFRRLNRVEALRLAEAKGLALADQPNFSLAELYCGVVSSPVLNAERQIGFAQ